MAGGKKKSKHQKKLEPAKKGGKPRVVAPGPDPTAVVEPVPTPAPVIAEAPGAARRGALTEMVPVRFDAPTLAAVKQAAADDHRSVSSWIRRAVDQELQRGRV